ncbi:hypothetical protein VCHENC02_1220B, partial [Vibrio harveyi]
LSSSDFSIC